MKVYIVFYCSEQEGGYVDDSRNVVLVTDDRIKAIDFVERQNELNKDRTWEHVEYEEHELE